VAHLTMGMKVYHILFDTDYKFQMTSILVSVYIKWEKVLVFSSFY